MSWKVHETDEVFAALRGLCSNSYRMYDPCEHRYYYDHDCETYECAVEDAAQEYERLLRHCEKQREELAAIKNPLGKLKEEFMGSIEGSSKVRAGSSITDELRGGMSPCISDDWLAIEKSTFETLADRIDEQHAVKVERLEKYRAAVDAMLKEYVKLPVDADGVPIHVGDELTDGINLPAKVRGMALGEDGWIVSSASFGGTRVDQSTLRHVKPDSWERIMDDAEKLARGDNAAVMELVERCRRLAHDGR